MDNEIFRSNKYYWIDTFREGLAAIQLNRNGALLIHLVEKYALLNMIGLMIFPKD